MEASAAAAGGLRQIGIRIREARERAGLTQRALAKAIGTRLWVLDQLEEGRRDPTPHLEAIASATHLSVAELAPETFAPVRAVTPERGAVRVTLVSETARRNLVLASLTALIVVRFFTEVVPVLPRAANFIDIPILVVLCVVALAVSAERESHSRYYLTTAPLVILFLTLASLSALMNLPRVEVGPILVFVYGFLAPLGIYAAVYRLWPPGSARAVTKLLVVLTVVQLLVVVGIDVPRFLSTNDPDQISGTFGTNAYQLVFFLLTALGALAGIFTFERERLAARAAPFVIVLAFATIVLAQYRALLVSTAVSIVVIAVLLGGARARAWVALGIAAVSFVIVVSYVASNLPYLKFGTTLSTIQTDPTFYASKRLEALSTVGSLFSDEPRFIVTGSGPGTFSSRAWQTFANAGSESRSNVQGRYVRLLGMNEPYSTDVSDRYIRNREQTAAIVEGSGAVTSPFSSYTSLMAEIGVLGFLSIVGLYVAATARAVSMARKGVRRARTGDPLPAILVATSVSFVLLLQMAFLENWLEVTRVTFIAWALLAIGGKEVAAREPE
jgi:transcriptional regulator with XRE-family HTH domain